MLPMAQLEGLVCPINSVMVKRWLRSKKNDVNVRSDYLTVHLGKVLVKTKVPLAKFDCKRESIALGTTNDHLAVENRRASDDKDFVP